MGQFPHAISYAPHFAPFCLFTVYSTPRLNNPVNSSRLSRVSPLPPKPPFRARLQLIREALMEDVPIWKCHVIALSCPHHWPSALFFFPSVYRLSSLLLVRNFDNYDKPVRSNRTRMATLVRVNIHCLWWINDDVLMSAFTDICQYWRRQSKA